MDAATRTSHRSNRLSDQPTFDRLARCHDLCSKGCSGSTTSCSAASFHGRIELTFPGVVEHAGCPTSRPTRYYEKRCVDGTSLCSSSSAKCCNRSSVSHWTRYSKYESRWTRQAQITSCDSQSRLCRQQWSGSWQSLCSKHTRHCLAALIFFTSLSADIVHRISSV